MTDAVARTLSDARDAGRPGFVRFFLLVLVGAGLGVLLGLLALEAPALVGVNVPDISQDPVPFASDAVGGWWANVAVGAVMVWAVTLGVRSVLGVAGGYPGAPGWTWLLVALVPAAVLASTSDAITVQGGGAIAAVALYPLLYTGDGRVRPEPFAVPLPRRVLVALGVVVPVVLIGVATGYAIVHPLATGTPTSAVALKPGRTPVALPAPLVLNQGGRPVRVVGVEPGVERGFALHLVNVEILPNIGYWKDRTPFRSFVVPAHGDSFKSGRLVLTFSRAGCRPGATGRVDSIRVRYVLGGERSMLLPLDRPLTLRC